jgi:uncharacterized membrane protein YagU involved in acid resistance
MHTIQDSNQLPRFLTTGAIVGIIAGVVMAMYAMIASATILGQGFFTPLYGIASPLIGPQAMMTSMKQGIYFDFGPAVLGLIIHMMWSALYGIIFGLIARLAHLKGNMAIIAGLFYGLLIFLSMSYVILPIVGAGAMPGMVGYPSFIAEHLIFGGVLGLWPMLRLQDFPTIKSQQARQPA